MSSSCISLDDISYIHQHGPHSTYVPNTISFRHDTRQIYDIDASGYVTKKNLSKMLAIHTGMDQVKDSWKVTVSRYDHHSNTVVDASEKLKQTDLNSISDVMVETAMAFYDTDKDGKLNMNEFRHFAEDSYEIAMMLESWKEPERIDAPWKCVEMKESEEVE